MQTLWQGSTLPSGNLVWEEAMIPFSRWVALPDIATVPKSVHLPARTHGVCLWAPQDMVWYGLDAAPGPILPPTTAEPVLATDFAFGGCAMPGQWQTFAVPQPEVAHILHLRSTVESAQIFVTALTEES
jgi:hypothetical protein